MLQCLIDLQIVDIFLFNVFLNMIFLFTLLWGEKVPPYDFMKIQYFFLSKFYCVFLQFY